MNKKAARLRRARRTREHIKRLGHETGIARLCIHRSLQHIGVQIIAPKFGKIMASATSLDKTLRDVTDQEGGKVGMAKRVGKLIAERAIAAGVQKVACDRAGYKYHGRVAALVDAARENGLVI